MYYYKDKNSNEPKGSFTLSPFCVIQKKEKDIFIINAPHFERILYLKTETEKECEKWVKILNEETQSLKSEFLKQNIEEKKEIEERPTNILKKKRSLSLESSSKPVFKKEEVSNSPIIVPTYLDSPIKSLDVFKIKDEDEKKISHFGLVKKKEPYKVKSN